MKLQQTLQHEIPLSLFDLNSHFVRLRPRNFQDLATASKDVRIAHNFGVTRHEAHSLGQSNLFSFPGIRSRLHRNQEEGPERNSEVSRRPGVDMVMEIALQNPRSEPIDY